MAYDLQRFKDAQNAGNAYKNALKEIGNGLKEEICNSLVQVRGKSAAEIFGPVDTMKLRSSMTLFYLASGKEEIFRKVLAKYFDEKLDQKTVDML